MAIKQEYYTIGGDFFLKERGSLLLPEYMGDVGEASIDMSIETVSLQSSGNETGELAIEEVSRTSAFKAKPNSITAANISRFVYGNIVPQAAATALTFALPVMKAGQLFRLGYVNVSNVEVGSLVAGVDYTLRAKSGAIVALRDLAATPDGTFDAAAGSAIGIMSAAAREYEITFISEKTGKTVVIYRWKPNPAETFNLISKEFASLSVSGPCLLDETKPDGPLGRIGAIYSI